MIQDIDESKLSRMERLGLAWCRMNSWEWDEMLGKKPEGFDGMAERPDILPNKYALICHQMARIEQMLGMPYLNLCWFRFALGKSEEEWLRFREELENPDHPFYRAGDSKKCQKCCYRKLNHLVLLIRKLFFKERHLTKANKADVNG